MTTAVRQQGKERRRRRWGVLGAGIPALAIAAVAVAAGGCSSSPSAAPQHQTTTPTQSTTPVTSPPTTPVTTPVTTPTTSTTPVATTQPTGVALTSAEITAARQGSKAYTVGCDYPVLSGAAGSTSVDAAIHAAVVGEIATFEKDADGGALVPNAPAPWQMTCTWATVWISPTLGSVRLTDTVFPAGAAHPHSQISSFNFDPATGEQYTLAGVFRMGADYLKVLSQESAALLPAVLKADGGNITGYEPAVGPQLSNFSAWTVTPAGIGITFQEYQVAPYAWGTPAIQIPLTALSAIANPAGPLA